MYHGKEAGSDKSDEGECNNEAERDEVLMYNETYNYLFNGCYPPDTTKVEKGVIRKRASLGKGPRTSSLLTVSFTTRPRMTLGRYEYK